MATAAEQRSKVIAAIKSREGKNTYTQSSNRDKVASGFGDCSSTVRWAYKSTLGIDIGGNTEAQLNSSKGKAVPLLISSAGIPDESKMLPGDCLYFRGNDSSRTKGVGHVEMYVGNGQLSGHGSGKGPTRKTMTTYCKQRQNTKSTSSSLKNRGLICVKRFIDANSMPVASTSITSNSSQYYKKSSYTGFSFVDALNKSEITSTLAFRKIIAKANGITGYAGSAAHNDKMLNLLKSGKLIKP